MAIKCNKELKNITFTCEYCSKESLIYLINEILEKSGLVAFEAKVIKVNGDEITVACENVAS